MSTLVTGEVGLLQTNIKPFIEYYPNPNLQLQGYNACIYCTYRTDTQIQVSRGGIEHFPTHMLLVSEDIWNDYIRQSHM